MAVSNEAGQGGQGVGQDSGPFLLGHEMTIQVLIEIAEVIV